MSVQNDLEMILRSHYPIVIIETHEERRAINLLKKVVSGLNLDMHTWSNSIGFQPTGATYPVTELKLEGFDSSNKKPDNNPESMLIQVKKSIQNSVIALLDFHPYLEEARITRLIKEIALEQRLNRNTLVMVSHALDIPGEIKRLCASFELSLPNATALEQLITDEAKVWTLKIGTTSKRSLT